MTYLYEWVWERVNVVFTPCPKWWMTAHVYAFAGWAPWPVQSFVLCCMHARVAVGLFVYLYLLSVFVCGIFRLFLYHCGSHNSFLCFDVYTLDVCVCVSDFAFPRKHPLCTHSWELCLYISVYQGFTCICTVSQRLFYTPPTITLLPLVFYSSVFPFSLLLIASFTEIHL